MTRVHPQASFVQTTIDPSTFHGQIRRLYGQRVLRVQLEQLKKQGSYYAFRGAWHPVYDIRRLAGARTRPDGIPPSLFWESDVAKWIEAACYFMASEGDSDLSLYKQPVEELVEMIQAFQQDDGYLGIYFTVVDPAGRLKNFRDMHELYNAGHLLEAALAHFHVTKSTRFLDIMRRNVDFWIKYIGRGADQIPAYCGHPEMELALLRLHALTGDIRHLQFAEYLLSERGQAGPHTHMKPFFRYEADELRCDIMYHHQMDNLDHLSYLQAHKPLHDQQDILGHSVRAMYLLTAAADFGDTFENDARRLWTQCVEKKMYATGGIGTEPRFEGFHPYAYRLPQSSAEGGGYAETCASIAGMMCSERLLSWKLDGKVRDAMELMLLNQILGGGSMNGKQFSYNNVQATCDTESAIRCDWFEVCCCPPNLSRIMGSLGGYIWNASVCGRVITVDLYMFISAARRITLPDGTATVGLRTDMPWTGTAEITVHAPEGWSWLINIPVPEYVDNLTISRAYVEPARGYRAVQLSAKDLVTINFDLPIHFLSSHPLTNSDTLIVKRGPIVYTAESVDNVLLERRHPHFADIGLSLGATFTEEVTEVEGVEIVNLICNNPFALQEVSSERAWERILPGQSARAWRSLSDSLVLTPWFARGNKGGTGHIRTAFRRVDPNVETSICT